MCHVTFRGWLTLYRFRDIASYLLKVANFHPPHLHWGSRLGLATVNLQTKFYVSNYSHYEDMKSGTKCTNWGSLGRLKGHKVTCNVTIWQSAYDFLFDFNRNHASTLYRFRDIASYLLKVANFHPPHLHLAPPWGMTAVEFCGDLWRQKTRVPGVVFFMWSYV